MTALRQQLFDAVNILPEDKISVALQYIRENLLPQQKKKEATILDLKNLKNFHENMAKKYGLKENADEIQQAIDRVKGVLSSMSEADKNKSIAEWREERLREKYAEYFD